MVKNVGLFPTRGKYTGNGTSQSINTHSPPHKVAITRKDRKFEMTAYYDETDGATIGRSAIDSSGNYRKLEVLSGGITITETGFDIGEHVSVNENGQEYMWEVE